jgi:hypothetical protein
VSSNGDGSFNVNASGSVEGVSGGTVTVTAPMFSTTNLSGIRVHFQRGDTGSFDEGDCTAAFTNTNMGVAAGRIWAQVTCPKATMSNTSPPHVCEGDVEIRFENCGQ